LSFELLGPEYSLKADTLKSGIDVFLSRTVALKTKAGSGEDLVEKQNAEIGQMPIVVDEESAYGYTGENRYFVKAFLQGQTPWLTFEDGREVVRLMMLCYKSAEQGISLDPRKESAEGFVPQVAQGIWKSL